MKPLRTDVVPPNIQPWELELIDKVARAFRTDDREELIAELRRKAAALKNRPPTAVRDWRSYFAKFLYNKASNWVRNDRARRKKEMSAEVLDRLDALPADSPHEPDAAERIEFEVSINAAWAELSAELRRLCVVLFEQRGNRVATARRMGVHRNTVGLWIIKIRSVLKRHG